jgi:hypothetical protein
MTLPGEWDSKCDNKFKKILISRCFREDLIINLLKDSISDIIDQKLIEGDKNDSDNLKDVMGDSTPQTPVVIILSHEVDATTASVDPKTKLTKLAQE